jgi:hypothetical protein
MHAVHGDPCPTCSNSALDEYGEEGDANHSGRTPGKLVRSEHLVDLANFFPIGQCACEHFQFRLKPQIEEIPPRLLQAIGQVAADKLRCTHIFAARHHALDRTIYFHQRYQMSRAGKQTEEAQP